MYGSMAKRRASRFEAQKGGVPNEVETPPAGFEPATCGLEVADLQGF
jgi:hypothetical protein